ncbi:zinc finger protein 578-like [Diorhabda sublineata]|uniref:zinc finger protein 578-like n=1 Tax=Diorhabda sublineata TaxID=1163346 RepID=UPI0024E12053|nr:zinc finger protein 578-like [Diorhabda sublineata]
MESVIREGTLKLLKNESTCDVILSCQGRRLMAHKVILSMVSPVFRDLLKEDGINPAVVIFPDSSSNIMALILDYIYTGSTMVYSNSMEEFVSLMKFLKIKLDKSFPIPPKTEEKQETLYKVDTHTFIKSGIENYKKNKTLPELIPIKKIEELRKRQKMSCVLPSPWKPRIETIYGDPREAILEQPDYMISTDPHHHSYENDSNNNYRFPARVRYKQNLLKKEETCSLESISTLDAVFLNTHQAPKVENGLNVDIDRKNDKLILPDLSVRETHTSNQNSSRRSSSSEDFKDNSNGSMKSYGYKTISDREDEAKFDESNSDKRKPFKCEQCGKCFSQLRNYKYHRSVHDGTKEFAAKCPECGKIFNDKGYLSSHLKIHRDKKEYACSHCPKRFNQRVAYNMHTRIHTGLKPHECSACGKSFSRKMLLKQHQRVHTGERPYSCPECGKTFADRSNMSLHARLHTGIKPYTCSLCPKSFTKKHHLKTHMNFHTGLKPYTCEKCGLAFSQSSNMRTHYKKCLLKNQYTEKKTQNEHSS